VETVFRGDGLFLTRTKGPQSKGKKGGIQNHRIRNYWAMKADKGPYEGGTNITNLFNGDQKGAQNGGKSA